MQRNSAQCSFNMTDWLTVERLKSIIHRKICGSNSQNFYSVSLLSQAIASGSKESFVPPVQAWCCLRTLAVSTQAVISVFVRSTCLLGFGFSIFHLSPWVSVTVLYPRSPAIGNPVGNCVSKQESSIVKNPKPNNNDGTTRWLKQQILWTWIAENQIPSKEKYLLPVHIIVPQPPWLLA